jgi:UDPglucose 6-dehydrogenase
VGNGAGGSCFGKDLRSLAHQLDALGETTDLLRTVLAINESQKTHLLDRAALELDVQFEGMSVAVLGLAFKKNTNDMRDASSIAVVEDLLGRGVTEVRVYDPLVKESSVRKAFAQTPARERITIHASIEDALAGTRGVFLSNDSEELRVLRPIILRTVIPPYVVMDGRCMIRDYDALLENGINYIAVGGPARQSIRTSRKEVAA